MFLESLNGRQREAVFVDGGALVLAGAGTGKTRVLTGRIARLILHDGQPHRAILAVTFTNKAAREMRERVEGLLRRPARDLAIGTFHGINHRILRRHAAAAGLDKNFQILDTQDQLSFIKRLLRERNIDANQFPPGEVRGYVSARKEEGLRAAAAIDAASHSRARQMAGIYALYEEVCRAESKVDFGELMLRAVELLRADDNLRAHYAGRFRHILIDEFQDTNRLQFEWLRLLDSGDNAFFAVGDDDQSIYAFRGTRPENMRDFQTQLRAPVIIRLEQNYRSTARILSAANKLIANNRGRLGKNLSAVGGKGDPLRLEVCGSDLDEASAIANGIVLAVESGTPADAIAVLYRTNAQSRAIEQKMVECGIAYRIYGGTRFYDRAEVKHALAYLRLAASADVDSLLRVINFPPRGIGAAAMAQLTKAAEKDGWQRAMESSGHRGIRQFVAMLAGLRAGREALPLGELAKAAVEKSGLTNYYESRNDGRERAENLREFVNAAAQFQASEDDALMQFLANAALESGESDSPSASAAAVSLMTVHAAKGLEFDAVFVAGLEEGLFPHANSLDSGSAVEEERRLMYVAITRARKMLVLHCARSRMHFGNRQYNPPSRFLDELECFRPPPAPPVPSVAAKRQPINIDKVAVPMPHRALPQHSANDASAKVSAKVSGDGFRPGSSVRHARYGLGVVLALSGDEITIAFKMAGKKTFKTALVKLQKMA